MQQLNLFGFVPERLPRRPYCSDDLSLGVLIRPLQTALTYRHLQMNPPNAVCWLVVDIDSPVISDPISPQMAAIFDGRAPLPNYLAVNPENGHAHAYFALARPVAKGCHESLKALRYTASIEASLIRVFGADPLYAGVIAKNPIHQAWRRIDLRQEPYTLHELEDYLDLHGPDKSEQRAQVLDAGSVGRNCALFDRLRFHAYQYVTMYKADSSYEAWKRYLAAKADQYNDSSPILPANEVQHLVTSVAKWTWTKYTGRLSDEQFSKLQAYRGVKGGRISAKSRAAKAEQSGSSLSEQMKALAKQPRMTTKAVSASKPWEAEGISRATWYRRQK